MKNDEILSRLQALGVKIYKQKLSMILSNPFYCGIIAHKTLNGKLVVVTTRNSYHKNYSCVSIISGQQQEVSMEYRIKKRMRNTR
jgi:hypothetical protein